MADLLQQLTQVRANNEVVIAALRSGDPRLYQAAAPPLRNAQRLLGQLIDRYARRSTNAAGATHASPVAEPDWQVMLAAETLNPKRILPVAGPARQRVIAQQRRARHDLLRQAYLGLRSLQRTLPPNGWSYLQPYVSELHEVLMSINAPATAEGKRRTATLAAKIKGRIALMEGTGGLSREVAVACLASRYGQRLANLVAAGNQHAIDLVGLSEERDLYRSLPGASLDVLVEYEQQIAARQHHLGLETLTEATQFGVELANLMRLAAGAGFASRQHFQQHLCEGLLLNVNTLASRALAIPSGEYVVWLTDAGHTMLVPTAEGRKRGDVVVADPNAPVEVLTPQLVNCWNKLERVIGEAGRRKPGKDRRSAERPQQTDDRKTDKEDDDKREPHTTKAHEGLPNLRRARERAGLSLSDVSNRTGLAVSTIAKHELGYANPLYGSMEKIMDALRIDPETFYKAGPVEPYGHLDRAADEFDPYNVDVDHTGAGQHTGDAEHEKSSDENKSASHDDHDDDDHKGGHGPTAGVGR